MFALAVAVLVGMLVWCGSASAQLYVAMGDSVAAGAGLNPNPATNCHVSLLGYPGLVASQYQYTLDDFACANATMPAGILGPEVNKPSQLSQLFAAGTPQLVTITIGGNDIHWYQAVLDCYNTACGPGSLPSWVVADEQALLANLQTMLSDIGSHYAIPPTVTLTAYAQIFSPYYSCADTKSANPVVLAQAGAAIFGSLASTIQQATVGFPFARFAQPDFTGHELCTPDPWVQGVNDLAPYHPTAEGQQEFANVVEAASNGRARSGF